jgi:hypothetical protein
LKMNKIYLPSTSIMSHVLRSGRIGNQTMKGLKSLEIQQPKRHCHITLFLHWNKYVPEETNHFLRPATHYQVYLTPDEHTHYRVDLTVTAEKVRLSGLPDEHILSGRPWERKHFVQLNLQLKLQL